MIRKIACLLIGCAACLLCHPEAEAERIRFWHEWQGPTKDVLDNICRQFEKLHPGTEIEVLQVSNMNQKLLPAIAGGIPPDVVIFNRPMIPNWAAEDAFTALDERIQRDRVVPEDFLPSCWQECEFNGKIWGIPLNTDNRVLFWNKKIFREAGLDPETPPRTWNETEAFAERLTKRDATGKLERVGFYPLWGNSFFFIYAYPNGVTFLSEDGRRAIFNSEKAVETLEWIVAFARKYNIQSLTNFRTGFGLQAQDPFITGKVAMVVDGSWQPEYWMKYAPDLEIGTAPAPVPEGGQVCSWSGGMALVIPKHCQNVEEAWKFVLFATGYEAQTALARAYNIPTRTQVIKDLAPSMPDSWRVCAELMNQSLFLPRTPIQDTMFWSIERMCERAVFGELTPRQSIQLTLKETQLTLDRFYGKSSLPYVNWMVVSLIGIGLALGLLWLWRQMARRGRLGTAPTRLEAMEGYLFAAPWLIGFALFTAGPVFVSFVLSFCDYPVLSPARWAGLENYRTLLSDDPLFWKSLWNTIFFAAFHVPTSILAALLLAVLLNQPVRGISFFRTIFYLPSVISGVAVSVLWMWILNPEYGLLNAVLDKAGVPCPGWLSDPSWSKPAIVIMSLWGIGGGMIIFLAALQGIPRHLYESAIVDGASPFRQFWHITAPLLSSAIFFNMVMGIIASFQVFTQAYVMTNGGPLDSTLFYALYLYRTAFQMFRMGYSSAMAWILFGLILGLTLIQMRMANRWVYYEASEGKK